jgi:GTP-binding protein Era
VEQWKKTIPRCEVIPLSASSGINTKKVIKKIVELLPESPAYYDKEHLTDRNLRFYSFRDCSRKNFPQLPRIEIPYSAQVEVENIPRG